MEENGKGVCVKVGRGVSRRGWARGGGTTGILRETSRDGGGVWRGSMREAVNDASGFQSPAKK